MSYLLFFVIDEIEMCTDVFDAWEAIGVTGVTIMESTGLGRIRAKGLRDDLPLMPSLRNILQTREENHRTLMTLARDMEQVDAIIAATEGVVGDLNQPHKGVIFVTPVVKVVGIPGWGE